jgi:hypothetical protein
MQQTWKNSIKQNLIDFLLALHNHLVISNHLLRFRNIFPVLKEGDIQIVGVFKGLTSVFSSPDPEFLEFRS